MVGFGLRINLSARYDRSRSEKDLATGAGIGIAIRGLGLIVGMLIASLGITLGLPLGVTFGLIFGGAFAPKRKGKNASPWRESNSGSSYRNYLKD